MSGVGDPTACKHLHGHRVCSSHISTPVTKSRTFQSNPGNRHTVKQGARVHLAPASGTSTGIPQNSCMRVTLMVHTAVSGVVLVPAAVLTGVVC